MVERRKAKDIDVKKIRWLRRPGTARKKHLGQRLWRVFRLLYVLLVRMDASPHQVAFGFAVGVVLGVFPTFGLGGPIAIGLAFLFKLNKASTILGAMIMNPITTVPIWTASAFIGSVIWSANFQLILDETKSGRIFEALSYSTMVYMTGNLILAAAMAIAAYWLVFFFTRRYQTAKAKKRAEKYETS
jgi:hypothetical protein